MLVARLIEESQVPTLTDAQSRAARSCTPFMASMYGMGP
ncbi:hypothetical protein HNP02_003079 [Mycobacterium sp. AZCC_0083]|nr:hypothetical protein [Mycobacterium sp. AZCC_0083]